MITYHTRESPITIAEIKQTLENMKNAPVKKIVTSPQLSELMLKGTPLTDGRGEAK